MNFYRKKDNDYADFLVKLIIIIGAISAIAVAVCILARRFAKTLNALNEEEDLNFDDVDFLDDDYDISENSISSNGEADNAI